MTTTTNNERFLGLTIKQKCGCNTYARPRVHVVIEVSDEWTALRVECKNCGDKKFAPTPGSHGDQAQKNEWSESKDDENWGSLENCPQDD